MTDDKIEQAVAAEQAKRTYVLGQEPMLQFFTYAHLPAHLQAVSKPFGELAEQMVCELPRNPERSAGLRKLLEAKDCAVRALLFKATP